MGFVIAGLVVAVVAVSNWLWGAVFWKSALVSAAVAHPFLLLLLLAAVLVAVTAFLAERSAVSLLTGAGVVVTVLAMLSLPFWQTYAVQQSHLSSATVTAEEPPFDYDQRVPHSIALNQVNQNMQDSTGTFQRVRSMPGEGETALWNTLVVKAGWWVGYESVLSIDSPAFGNVSGKDITRCYFSENAQLRLGGEFPHNNLDRAVLESVLFQRVTFHEEDVFSYCDEDAPIVVIPLVEMQGFFDAHAVPYGVATYNGLTGALEVTRDVDRIAEIPGPTYPISVAAAQRGAMQSDGDYWDHVQHRLGWDVTGGEEIQLRVSGSGDVQYVTALDPRGDSTSVTALSVVEANGFVPGVLNTLTVFEREQSRAADSVVRDNVLNQYDWLPALATDRYMIHEIVPGVDGGWVASVGTDQSVVYRVIINAEGSELTLVDESGEEITRGNVPVEGTSDPVTGGEPAPDGEGGSSGLDLSGLSDEELVSVIQEAAEILSSR